MHFTKQNKKYYLDELKGSITNSFQFSLKSCNRAVHPVEEQPPTCKKCQLPLTASTCAMCRTDNYLPEGTMLRENYVYREKLGSEDKLQESVILCVDLSGSMSMSYQTTYKKVNQEMVCRVLGEKNFEFLKKRIGLEKVLNNYQTYQMLIDEGESVKSIVQIVKMEESHRNMSLSHNTDKAKQPDPNAAKEVEQYISRKEIIEITVGKLLTMMKNRSPQTRVTVVYFNNVIEIPTNAFNDKIVIHDLEGKTLEDMINLGVEYSKNISSERADNVGESLLQNLTKSSEGGATAMGPALAFCVGLAKAQKNNLNQIIVVTDGMSNVGFGQTEDQFQKQNTKKFYEEFALKHAGPSRCVVNVVTFEDCCIGYDMIDKMVEITGGIPCQIEFTEKGGEKLVTDDTFCNLAFNMINAFFDYPSQLCFGTQTTIACSSDKVNLQISDQLKPFVKSQTNNKIVLGAEVKSSQAQISIKFTVPENIEELEPTIKFMVVNSYFRNNKKNVIVCSEKVKIVKGSEQQVKKQQALYLNQELKDTTKTYREIFEENLEQYKKLSVKIEENKEVAEQLDQELLEKFNLKKQMLEQEYKAIDKLTREKLSMRSRAQKTFKEKSQDDDFDDGFV